MDRTGNTSGFAQGCKIDAIELRVHSSAGVSRIDRSN